MTSRYLSPHADNADGRHCHDKKPSRLWLPFMEDAPDARATTPLEMAKSELALGMRALAPDMRVRLVPNPLETEGFSIAREEGGYAISGGETGLLYGVYALLERLARGDAPASALSRPAFALRMLNHWDNMSGVVERGYAGGSLFFKDDAFRYDNERLRLYGRYLASIGVNVVSLNNVNVQPPADKLLCSPLLAELARVADTLRPFGIRLLAAVDYALPETLGLATADPLDADVCALWREVTDNVYAMIPDLAGYLVKADSEFRIGPRTYGRDHAQGAKPLADALAPHGGTLIWRCFVYNCTQDWRDRTMDRPKAAYEQYVPYDGCIPENTVLQVKYGPSDFQVREPNSPLLYAMPSTRKALELQLAQEYTGQQIDLYYMPPQWAEILRDLHESMPCAICAVSNLGNDENWTGGDLAQANLYAYGRTAWTGAADAEAFAGEWIRLTFGNDARVLSTLKDMLLHSRDIYEQYTSPLALGWMVNPGTHYGPSPEGYEYAKWGTYLRADREGVGIDRTSAGTNLTAQYPERLRALYESVASCPEKLLLYFHRLRYTDVLASGKTLIQTIYDAHFEGAERAQWLAHAWQSLNGLIAEPAYSRTRERLDRQVRNAREWRDVVNNYFYRLSGIPDEGGRTIY